MAHVRNSSGGDHDLLVKIQHTQLHKVSNGHEEFKGEGPFTITLAPQTEPPAIYAEAAGARWQLLATMPTLKATENTYMFAMSDNIFFSVLLATDTPHGEQQMLETLLAECTALQTGAPPSEEERSQLASEVEEDLMAPGATDPDEDLDVPQATDEIPPGRIAGASQKMQNKIQGGALWASKKILDASQQMQERYPPNETPMNISEAHRARIKVARKAAMHTAQGAAFVVTGLTDVAGKLADTMIKRLGRTKDAEALASQDEKKKRGAAKNVAASSVLAALEIYDSMESAAMLVARSAGQGSTGFIDHRYGPQAGEASRDVAATVYHGAQTVRSAAQLRTLGVRPIAKRVAKKTAKGVVKSWVKPTEVQRPGAAGAASGSTPAAQAGSTQTHTQAAR